MLNKGSKEYSAILDQLKNTFNPNDVDAVSDRLLPCIRDYWGSIEEGYEQSECFKPLAMIVLDLILSLNSSNKKGDKNKKEGTVRGFDGMTVVHPSAPPWLEMEMLWGQEKPNTAWVTDYLAPPDKKRLRAIEAYFALNMEAWPAIKDFRMEHLGGLSLTAQEAARFRSDPALGLFLPSQLREWAYDFRRHNSLAVPDPVGERIGYGMGRKVDVQFLPSGETHTVVYDEATQVDTGGWFLTALPWTPLASLFQSARFLADNFRWPLPQAVYVLLCGGGPGRGIPDVVALEASYHSVLLADPLPRNPGHQRFAPLSISLSVPYWLSSRQVAQMYRHMQNQLLDKSLGHNDAEGHTGGPKISDKQLELFLFVADAKQRAGIAGKGTLPQRKEIFRAWNAEHGNKLYKDNQGKDQRGEYPNHSRLFEDFKHTEKRILHSPMKHPLRVAQLSKNM